MPLLILNKITRFTTPIVVCVTVSVYSMPALYVLDSFTCALAIETKNIDVFNVQQLILLGVAIFMFGVLVTQTSICVVFIQLRSV